MLKRYGTSPGGSSRFALTRPLKLLPSQFHRPASVQRIDGAAHVIRMVVAVGPL